LYFIFAVFAGFAQIVFGTYLLPLLPLNYFGLTIVTLGVAALPVLIIQFTINIMRTEE
jgi:hypothetical protein